MEDAEAWARLSSLLDVSEREGNALSGAGDERLTGVLHAMNTLRAELVAALAALSADELEDDP